MSNLLTAALEEAKTYYPNRQIWELLVSRLEDKEYNVSVLAPGWMIINDPTSKLYFQLELGEPVNPRLLLVIVLNNKAPQNKLFPLIGNYDQLEIPIGDFPEDSMDAIVDSISFFTQTHERISGIS